MGRQGNRSRRNEPALVWERPEPPSRPAPSPLCRDRIISAAIELADAHGLESVSVRKIAAALQAGPMRLYGYVTSKAELLDLMVDKVYSEIALPQPTGGDWRTALHYLARGTRQAARRHEWFVDLLGGRPHLGPHALAYLEASMSTLSDAPGCNDIDTVLQAARTVSAYLIGALRAEITELRAERITGMDERRWQIDSGPYINRMLATSRYPTLTKVVRDATHPDADTSFDTGLNFVLDGIAAQHANPS